MEVIPGNNVIWDTEKNAYKNIETLWKKPYTDFDSTLRCGAVQFFVTTKLVLVACSGHNFGYICEADRKLYFTLFAKYLGLP